MRATVGLLLGFVAVAFAGPEERAKEIYKNYLERRLKKGYSLARLYEIRELGKLNCALARNYVLRILKTTPYADERVVGIESIVKIADLDALKATYSWLTSKYKPELGATWTKAMGNCPDPDLLEWLASDALKAAHPRAVEATAEALAIARVASAADMLVAQYRKYQERDPTVAAACIRALGAIGDERLHGQAFKHEDWRVRQAVADHPPRSLWNEIVRDPAAKVRRALAVALAKLRDEAAIPLLAGMLETEPRLRVRHSAMEALRAITDQDLGYDPSAWRSWLKERSGTAKPGRKTFARYYSFGVHSDRIVFLVDVSGSMFRPSAGRIHRIDVARTQLERVLSTLPPKTLFNVLVFSNRIHSWKKKEARADKEAVAEAIAWARERLVPDGDTHTLAALEHAFGTNPEFDTLFLLSDGNPSHGAYKSPEGVVAAVAVMNRFRRAAINTITLTLEDLDWGEPDGERMHLMYALMGDLAARNEGLTETVKRLPK